MGTKTYRNTRWNFEITLPSGWRKAGFFRRLLSAGNPEFFGPQDASLKIAIGPISPEPSLSQHMKNLERIAAKYGHSVLEIASIEVGGESHATMVYEVPIGPFQMLRLKNYHLIFSGMEYVITALVATVILRPGQIRVREYEETYDEIVKSFRIDAPEVLIFSWDGDAKDLTTRLSARIAPFAPKLLPVDEEDAGVAASRITTGDVVSCALFISSKAVQSTTFAEVVWACVRVMGQRQDFRLFIHLRDMELKEFQRLAAEVDAVKDLMDSVHLAEQASGESINVLVVSLREHLKALPELRNYLRYQRWKDQLSSLVPRVNLVLILQIVITVGSLAYLDKEAKNSPWFPWLLFGLGELWFLSVLALASLTTPLASGFYRRWILVIAPIALLRVWPLPVLAPHWPYLLAGFCTSALLDVARRMSVSARRKRVVVDLDTCLGIQNQIPIPGRHRFLFLANGPLFPTRTRVFISYARSSEWGRTVAQKLHQELTKVGVPSFLDVVDIAPGSSWRHRLQEQLGSATILVQVQDAVTVTRPWVAAELTVAAFNQSLCGLPDIVILRHPNLKESDLPPSTPPLVRSSLFPGKQADRPLLHVIEYTPDVPQTLAHQLTRFGQRYRASAVCVIPPYLAAFLELGIMPFRGLLGTLGVLGSFGAWAVLGGAWWLWQKGTQPTAWLIERRLDFWCLLLIAFWLGFVSRLAVASRFELRHNQANVNARFQYLSNIALIFILIWLVAVASPLAIVYAVLACGLGIIFGCDFIQTSLPLAGRMREQPSV